MTSNAIETQGTTVGIGNTDSPPVYTDIGEIKSFDGPNGSASVIDRSHLQSTAREKLMGLPDEGQVTFTGNYVGGDAGQVACRTARAARTQVPIKITLSNGDTLTFNGFVLGFSVSGGVDAVVEYNLTIEIDGPVTYTEAP